MTIKYLGGEKFEIKTGQTMLNLGYTMSIGDFVLPGAGEYEKSSVGVTAMPDGENTIFLIRSEEINLCYLGRINRELPEAEVKEIGNVDILFLPLGEDGTLSAKKAAALVNKIDPRIVIPMLYTSLDEFKKDEGISDGEMEALKIKKSDLPEEERRIVILNSK